VQCRMLFLVFALLASAKAQAYPPQISEAATSTVDVDMGTSPPINAKPGIDEKRGEVRDSAFVSVLDLGVPHRARKEYEKANQSFARRDWTQARDRLNKAISIYPAYADAYNNLAVAYEHLGDANQERQALEKAIAFNDHYALARLNFGRLEIGEGKLSEAEVSLKKAAALAPQDPRVLIVLGYCQFLQKHFDDTIVTSQEAHKLSAPHAIAHRLAARAYEQKRQFDSAAIELNLFLQEQPVGPAAEATRKELQIVEAAQRK
jgi:tetratricopeptide (TPR) repeat protein